MSPPPDDESGSAVAALARSAPQWLVLGGLLVFFFNMALAWTIAIRATTAITRPYLSEGGASHLALTRALDQSGGQANANTLTLLNRLIEADLDHGVVANKQTLSVVGMAVCFGLLAIGFALYVLGVRSAFQFSAATGDKLPTASVTLASAAPGLLCFLLAAIVAVVALTRESKVSLGNYTIYPDPAPTAHPVTTSLPVLPPELLESLKKIATPDPVATPTPR